MTTDQAKDILRQLLIGYRKDDGDYPAGFLRAFAQQIMRYDYTVATRAVQQCLCEQRFFPSIAEFVPFCRQAGVVDGPNAGAYRKGSADWTQLPEAQQVHDKYAARSRRKLEELKNPVAAADEWVSAESTVLCDDEEYAAILTAMGRLAHEKQRDAGPARRRTD